MASDYQKSDENETTIRRITCYSDHAIIVEVATENGLRCECARVPSWDFCVVKVWADKKTFKRCQYDWLQRMISQRHETEIEL